MRMSKLSWGGWILVISAILPPGVGQASGVASGTVTEISFMVTLPSPLNAGVVTASLDAKRQRISRLEVKLGADQISIPTKAFQDLPSPKLETVRLRYSRQPATDPEWYAVVGFEFGDPVCDIAAGECEEGKDWFSSVEIEIKQGRAVGRWIYRAEGEGSSRFDQF